VLIKLSQNKRAIIDDDDSAIVSRYHWTAVRHGDRWYAASFRKNAGGKRQTVYMHRVVHSAPKGLDVDHINMDGLDNRRCNLRIATRSLNMANSRERGGRSRYKGVSWSKHANKWRAAIQNGKMKNLGYFNTEIEAARAYDVAAKMVFGEFARLNCP